MTVSEARQILGPEIEDLNDQEVEQLIATTGSVCDYFLDVIENDLTLSKKKGHNGYSAN